jgi:hypothetical protein
MQYFDSHERVTFRSREIRNQLGLLPQTEVEFEMAGDHARSGKASSRPEAAARSKCFAVRRSLALTPTKSWRSREAVWPFLVTFA